MIPSTPILQWLITAFEQPTGFISENFYYDKRHKEFFSVMIFDYLILDENMERAGGATNNYSIKEEISLVDRIKRIENQDATIISIPRVTLTDRKEAMQQFVQSLSDPTLVDLLNQRIKNQDNSTSFDFYFGNEADESVIRKWKECRTTFLHQQVSGFLNCYDINIDDTTLWIPDSEGSVSIDLTKTEKAETSRMASGPQNKKWWRLW